MITAHAEQRAYERTNLNRRSSRRFIELAMERGKTSEDLEGFEFEQRFLRSKTRDGAQAVYYNQYIFIMADGRTKCVTMYQAPDYFFKNASRRAKLEQHGQHRHNDSLAI